MPSRAAGKNLSFSFTFHPRKYASAARQKIDQVSAVETPGWRGATRAHSRSYVTEEQRSQPGWIGRPNLVEILTGGTRRGRELPPRPGNTNVDATQSFRRGRAAAGAFCC